MVTQRQQVVVRAGPFFEFNEKVDVASDVRRTTSLGTEETDTPNAEAPMEKRLLGLKTFQEIHSVRDDTEKFDEKKKQS